MTFSSIEINEMNESKARKKEKGKRKKDCSFKSEFHQAKRDNTRQKRALPRNGRSKTVGRNLFTIQRNGFSRLLFAFV